MLVFILVYMFLVLVRPQDYPQWADSVGLPLLQITLMAAALFWLFYPRKTFDAPQYALLLLFFASSMFSHVANGWIGGAIEHMQKFAPIVLAFVVLSHAASSRRKVIATMATFTLCAGIMSLHGIEQVQTGIGWTGVELSQGTRIQYVGIFNDPNDLGLLFVACIPMAFYLGGRGGGMSPRRLFWWTIAGVLIYGVYLTNSRGALVATLAILGLYIWQRRGLMTASVLGAMAIAVMLALPSRFQEIDTEEESAQGRIESWYEGFQMFREYPLFGVGPEMYLDHYYLTAHNSFVLVMAEDGIVGFTLWLPFVVYGFRMMWAASRPEEDALEEGVLDEDALGEGMPEETDGPTPLTNAGAARSALVETQHSYSPSDEEAEEAAMNIAEDRKIAMTLLLSLSGFFTAAFFLSRSYVIVLYLLAALVVAHYRNQRVDDPHLPEMSLSRDLLLWPVVSVVSIAGLFVLVKILLAMQ